MFLSEDIDKQKYAEVISDIDEIKKSELPLREKYILLKRILERNCKEITSRESLQFPSLFARLVYISQKYSLPNSLEWGLQNIRIQAAFLQKDDHNIITQIQWKKALSTVECFFDIIYGNAKIVADKFNVYNPETIVSSFKEYTRIQVIDIDSTNKIITGKVNNAENQVIKAKYGITNINDLFNQTLDRLWIGAQLNLLDSKIDQNGYYIPQFIVLEPDYLIDTSSLAECFQNYGKSHLHYFRRRFEQTPNSQYILLGNLVNFFLDEFIYCDNPESLDFDKTFVKAFKERPFEFTSCTDIRQVTDFRVFMVKARTHFENIRRVIIQDFPKYSVHSERCSLEPSFFCERYGFQGRLDLLQIATNEDNIYKIIELKSGSLPFPKDDKTKIAPNHEVQTVIYRLIIQSVYNVKSRQILSTILYSSAENSGENLRLATTYHVLEKEIINIRNLIVATEHDLYTGDEMNVESLLINICNLCNYDRTPDFFKDTIVNFEKTFLAISNTEKQYFYRYIIFLARELYLQKAGDDYSDTGNSTSSLWCTEISDRKDAFNLISDLEITDIIESGSGMLISFQRKENSNFSNFREGEICILYPHDSADDTVLTNQILKGTLTEISANAVVLKFRYKQKNTDFFRKHKSWIIEHDRLDHTYNNMYKNLYSFLQSPLEKRELLLGIRQPETALSLQEQGKTVSDNITDKQHFILQKAISAKDYFLIVGPPGTGKTSIFARKLIEHYYNNTNNNILIIAYTNRAVDELCDVICSAFNTDSETCDKFVRIGTEFSCDSRFKHRLLQNISSKVFNREELRNILVNQRIIIGTLAAIIGKPEIFDFKHFNIAIIDEASQILEPQIIGLLPKIDKFIMIGDHKQLSTITLQTNEKASIDNKLLNIIELYNCKESLFERLFRVCQKKGWTYAFDTLSYQGRMHADISKFPNENFYDGLLRTVHDWQIEPLKTYRQNPNDYYQKIISDNRVAFINCSNNKDLNDKLNTSEADIATELSKSIVELYKTNNLKFDTQKTLGIIAPYRNQIALIKHKLKETNIEELQDILVDTVERFQGSQKDIIILSFCLNKPYQLDFFCNLNHEKTVDRKLNVALTRARQQLFLIGNKDILIHNSIYKDLIYKIKNY